MRRFGCISPLAHQHSHAKEKGHDDNKSVCDNIGGWTQEKQEKFALTAEGNHWEFIGICSTSNKSCSPR